MPDEITNTENGTEKRRGRKPGFKLETFFLCVGTRGDQLVTDEIQSESVADAVAKFKESHKGVALSDKNVFGPYRKAGGKTGVQQQPPHLQIKVSMDQGTNYTNKRYNAVYRGFHVLAMGLHGFDKFKDNELVFAVAGEPVDPKTDKRSKKPRFGSPPVMRLADLEQVKEIKAK